MIVALAGVAAVVLAELGGLAVSRARARSAADAAALAGAVEGRSGADEVARANGAVLASFEAQGQMVEVVIELDGATARARAEATRPSGPGPAGGDDRDGLAPVLLAALGRADDLLGRVVPVASGFRSRAEQERLWANRASNPYPVARPGTSGHERGMAIDVPSSFVPALVSVAAEAGLCQPLPRSDPVHFVPCGGGDP